MCAKEVHAVPLVVVLDVFRLFHHHLPMSFSPRHKVFVVRCKQDLQLKQEKFLTTYVFRPHTYNDIFSHTYKFNGSLSKVWCKLENYDEKVIWMLQ